MAIFFWDSKGIIFWHFLQQNENMNALLYCQMLGHLKNAIEKKRRRSLRNSNHFMHLQNDDATPHRTRITVEKFNGINLPTICHPPYSQDLSPSDFFLLKSFLSGKIFTSHDDVRQTVERWFASKSVYFFAAGIYMHQTDGKNVLMSISFFKINVYNDPLFL